MRVAGSPWGLSQGLPITGLMDKFSIEVKIRYGNETVYWARSSGLTFLHALADLVMACRRLMEWQEGRQGVDDGQVPAISGAEREAS